MACFELCDLLNSHAQIPRCFCTGENTGLALDETKVGSLSVLFDSGRDDFMEWFGFPKHAITQTRWRTDVQNCRAWNTFLKICLDIENKPRKNVEDTEILGWGNPIYLDNFPIQTYW